MKIFYFAAAFLAAVSFSPSLFADSYENYRNERDSSNSEYIAAAAWGVYDNLRGSIKNEINENIDGGGEQSDASKPLSDGELNDTIRKIIREEVKEALGKGGKKFLTSGIFEMGGFVSGQINGASAGNGGDKATTIATSGIMNYFVANNFALGIKGGGDFDITMNHQLYYVGFGPTFAMGLNNSNSVCLYVAIHGCLTVNSFLDDMYGFRYSNEIGFKFVLGRSIINLGVAVGFENNKAKNSDYNTIVTPMLGISTWL
ncbi:MAG: hypothetical protein LBT84_07775 [Spirochaetia bacterium]|jgi:hypothetical protein|nr:hypothetical protein [Spirochaetia bacterium]